MGIETPTPTTAATAIPYINFGEEMSLIEYISFAWMYSVFFRERARKEERERESVASVGRERRRRSSSG